MNIDQTRSLIKRYFAGLTEQTFQTQLGVADPMLTDYLTDMLVRFVRCDRVYRIRNVTGKTLGEDAVNGRRDKEWLNSHVQKPIDGRWRVVGM